MDAGKGLEVMARQISERVIQAMRMIEKGATPYSSATTVGYPPNSLYKLLARYNAQTDIPAQKAALFLADYKSKKEKT